MSVRPIKKQTYFQKLRDPRWQKMRLSILERDQFTCKSCGSKEKTLTVHHARYDRFDEDSGEMVKASNSWDAEPSFLITLCEECHKERQELENSLKVVLSSIPNPMLRTLNEFLAFPGGLDQLRALLVLMEGHLYRMEHQTYKEQMERGGVL